MNASMVPDHGKRTDLCTAATVLVADDRAEDRMLVRVVLERMGCRVIEAEDGQQALDVAQRSHPHLILSDILMPVMDGFTFCRRLLEDPLLRHVPFVFLTATYGETHDQQFAAEVCGSRVLVKPFSAKALRAVVLEALDKGPSDDATQRLELIDERRFHQLHAEAVNGKLEQKIRELEQANAGLLASETRTRALLDSVICTITKMIEFRDPYTTGHEMRVGQLAAAIGRSLGFCGDRLDGLRLGGQLHDVGKIAVPAEILTKPGRLTQGEFSLIREHARIGHEILSGIEFPWPVADIALQHHERLDGSGYPHGLVGEQILPEARILAVADVVEAMVSHRPYRPSLGIDEALAEIARGRGALYDPQAVDACLRLFRDEGFLFD
jgi:putative two-component system response regulator